MLADQYKFAYVGSAYSHPDSEVRRWRYLKAVSYVRQRLLEGIVVYSPIVHCHPIQEAYPNEFPTEFEFWRNIDLTMLSKASSFHYLVFEGHFSSKGLAAEKKFAIEQNIPIEYYALCPDIKIWKRND